MNVTVLPYITYALIGQNIKNCAVSLDFCVFVLSFSADTFIVERRISCNSMSPPQRSVIIVAGPGFLEHRVIAVIEISDCGVIRPARVCAEC